jgi:hypothetical protein
MRNIVILSFICMSMSMFIFVGLSVEIDLTFATPLYVEEYDENDNVIACGIEDYQLGLSYPLDRCW